MKVERQVKRILLRIISEIEFHNKRPLGTHSNTKSTSKKQRNESIIDLSEYYFVNGFRKVCPYWFTWTAIAKGRWVGRTVHDVYNAEFSRAILGKDIDELIETGRIMVNHHIVKSDYCIRDHDIVSHLAHRHEAPVLNIPINICHECKDFIAVNKPPSIPVHPCGRYCLNSITSILAKEKGMHDLKLVHRLDRTTSGVLIFAKNRSAAQRAEKLISSRVVSKRYVCLVEESLDKKLEVDFPIKVLSYKHGICRIARYPGEEGSKEAKTIFRPFNGTKSKLVECIPSTGRMHQIRVHLQAVGLPISNDELYNNKIIWGEYKGMNGNYCGMEDYEIIKRFADSHWYKDFLSEDLPKINDSNGTFDKTCFECTHTFIDPDKDKMVVYLHAYEYIFPDADKTIQFKAPLPEWALEKND